MVRVQVKPFEISECLAYSCRSNYHLCACDHAFHLATDWRYANNQKQPAMSWKVRILVTLRARSRRYHSHTCQFTRSLTKISFTYLVDGKRFSWIFGSFGSFFRVLSVEGFREAVIIASSNEGISSWVRKMRVMSATVTWSFKSVRWITSNTRTSKFQGATKPKMTGTNARKETLTGAAGAYFNPENPTSRLTRICIWNRIQFEFCGDITTYGVLCKCEKQKSCSSSTIVRYNS